jgi:hypothetical protein
MKDQEVPVKLSECRRVFGRGRTWMSAIKRELGVKGNFVLMSDVRRFIRDNPTWTEGEVYRRSKNACWVVRLQAGSARIRAPRVEKSGERSVRAGRVEIEFDGEVVDVK